MPGRVPDCSFGLRLVPGDIEAVGALVVGLAALLHPSVPQPDGSVLYALVTATPTGQPTS